MADKLIKDLVIKTDLIYWKTAVWLQSNLKELSKENYKKLKESLIKNNFVMPFTVWQDGETVWILDGHHRQKVMQMLIEEGYQIPDKLPANFIECKDKKDAAEKVLVYSSIYAKITDEGLYEFLSLNDLKIEDIKETLDLPNIDIGFFEDNFYQNEGLTDEDIIPENITAVSKRGQIWKLGNHRIMCGDSTSESDILKLMCGKKADIVFTDPPYGVSYADKNKFLNEIDKGNRIQKQIQKDHMNDQETSDFWKKSFINIKTILSDKASYYIFSPQIHGMMMMMMMIDAGIPYRHVLIWVKNNHVLGRSDYNYKHEPLLFGWINTHNFYGNGKFLTSVWDVDKPLKNDLHPTMKPVVLAENALMNSSQIGELCLDIFLGSGSTLIACEKTNRVCFGMEIDEHYCDVIIKRWEDFTGKKAELISE